MDKNPLRRLSLGIGLWVWMILLGTIAGCTGNVLVTEEQREAEYMCTGDYIGLNQNAPAWATDTIVIVAATFQKGSYFDHDRNPQNGDSVALCAWLEDNQESSFSCERVGIGRHMNFHGYRFTVLSIRLPSGKPEPDGSVTICVEPITAGSD